MIDLDTAVDEAINQHPEVADLFVRHRMICVGCAIARFHTVRDVAVMYQLDPDTLLHELQQYVAERKSTQTASTSEQ
jgi:hybrid cluster-associated redox disulfide protein